MLDATRTSGILRRCRRIEYRVSRIEYPVGGLADRVSRIEYRETRIERQVLRDEYQSTVWAEGYAFGLRRHMVARMTVATRAHATIEYITINQAV